MIPLSHTAFEEQYEVIFSYVLASMSSVISILTGELEIRREQELPSALNPPENLRLERSSITEEEWPHRVIY